MADAASGWTDDRVELLGKLWGEGLSASQIAATLGGGVTRNAVIGKVHRLGLAGRAKPGQAPPPPRAAKPRPAAAAPLNGNVTPILPKPQLVSDNPAGQPVAPRAEPVDVVIPVSERVSILDLRESMCRWPLGDPTHADFGFCGKRSETGLPYCPTHCRIAYQPAADRKRLRA